MSSLENTAPVEAPESRARAGVKAFSPARFLPRKGEALGALSVPVWVHAAVLLVLAGLTVYIARSMWAWTYDDVYIIFRYARNFANGLGMVYNAGEHYLGTSSPGYTLLLAAIYKLSGGVDMLALSSIISALGLFASASLVWLIGLQARTPVAGALGAFITVTNPLLVVLWGSEMLLLLPLVLGAVLCYSRGLGALTGLLLGLAVLTRQDSLVLVAAVCAHYILTKRRLPLSGIGALLIALLPWVIYSWVFFGSPLPGTLEAKVAQGKAGWAFFLSGAIGWLGEILGPGLPRIATLSLIPVGALTLLVEAWRRKPVGPWFLALAWCALFTAGYTALRVAFYGWYAIPMAVGLGLLVAWGVAGVGQAVAAAVSWLISRASSAQGEGAGSAQRTRRTLAAAIVPALLVAGLVSLPTLSRLRTFDMSYMGNHRLSDLYERVGKWLAQNGGERATAAYLEVGEIGWYSDSRIVDLLGLVTPGAAAHVPYWDYEWAVLQYKPTYYLASTRFNDSLRNIQNQAWFQQSYTKVATFEDHIKTTTTSYEMTVYKLTSDSHYPRPMRPVAGMHNTQQGLWLTSNAPARHFPGQSFSSPEKDLSGIAVLMGKPKEISGTLIFHLRDSAASTRDIRTVTVPLSDVGNNTWQTFRFEPLPDSRGREYFFSLEVKGPTDGEHPVAIWYATDDLYKDGTRYDGAKAQPGDLCFMVYVPDPLDLGQEQGQERGQPAVAVAGR